MKKIQVINGPNLNLLGKREPSIYGSQTFEKFFAQMQEEFALLATLTYFQSNSEGAIIDELHRIGFEYDGIIINAGAYTHTSVAIADALAAIQTPAIEVHISNVHKREAFRHHSYLSANVSGIIIGCGLNGYNLAVRQLLELESG